MAESEIKVSQELVEKRVPITRENVKLEIAGAVTSVNGKTGEVVLTTSDLENDSDYQTGDEVASAIQGAISQLDIPTNVSELTNDAGYQTASEVASAVAGEATLRETADNNLQTQIDAISASSDVTDIVGTYAELQAYDTSTLGDKDIIKVLQDESRNDETTYYRWSTTTQTFTLIGEEGPYYTKSAADAKFQDKLTAGTNINIDANNEISATDTTYSAGSGLDLTGTTFSVDTTTIQEKLTAGTNVSITNNTISATDTTYSDFTGTDGQTAGTAGLVPAPATTDDGKFLNADGSWTAVPPANFATGEAVSALKIYSGLGSNTDGLVLQKYVPAGFFIERSSISGPSFQSVAAGRLKDNADVTKSEVYYGYALDNSEYKGIKLVRETVNGKGALLADADPFSGATSSADGVQGMVPKPLAGDEDKILKGDGTWTINYKTLNGAGAPTTATVGDYVGQLYYDTTNDKMYYLVSIDTSVDPVEYNWSTFGGGGPTVVQTTGTSTTDVMSQKAVTNMIWPAGYEGNRDRLLIAGPNASVSGSGGIVIATGNSYETAGQYSVVVGTSASASPFGGVAIGGSAKAGTNGQENIALGYRAQVSGSAQHSLAIGARSTSASGSSVALGYNARTSRAGEVNIGTGTTTVGYNSTSYRVLGGVHDAVDDHDATTLGQLNARIVGSGTAAPTTSTAGSVGALYAYVENGTGHLAICTAVSGTTYTWQTLI